MNKFKELETLIRVDPALSKLVTYYREFNKEVLTKPEESLAMLAYVAAYGDENIALYEHRSKSKGAIPEEI